MALICANNLLLIALYVNVNIDHSIYSRKIDILGVSYIDSLAVGKRALFVSSKSIIQHLLQIIY